MTPGPPSLKRGTLRKPNRWATARHGGPPQPWRGREKRGDAPTSLVSPLGHVPERHLTASRTSPLNIINLKMINFSHPLGGTSSPLHTLFQAYT
jgi:hypothetical protein